MLVRVGGYIALVSFCWLFLLAFSPTNRSCRPTSTPSHARPHPHTPTHAYPRTQRFYAILVEYLGHLCDHAASVDPEFLRTLLDKLPIVLFSMGTDMPHVAAEAFR